MISVFYHGRTQLGKLCLLLFINLVVSVAAAAAAAVVVVFPQHMVRICNIKLTYLRYEVARIYYSIDKSIRTKKNVKRNNNKNIGIY